MRADSRECEVFRVSKGIGMFKKGGGEGERGRTKDRERGDSHLVVRVSDEGESSIRSRG